MDINLKYGAYSHDAGECAVMWSCDPILKDGERTGVLYTIDIRGRLHGDTQAALTTAIGNLNAAYSVDNQDIGLVFSDGSRTAHYLSARSCSGGVRVVRGPSYPVGDGGQYSTYRDYSISVEAEIGNDDLGEPGIASWTETVVASGGGRQVGFLETLNGPPQQQILKQQTVYRATQSGEAVGERDYPIPPPPIWSASFQQDKSTISRTCPKKAGSLAGIRQYKEYRVAWNYIFESATPLIGLPTLPR